MFLSSESITCGNIIPWNCHPKSETSPVNPIKMLSGSKWLNANFVIIEQHRSDLLSSVEYLVFSEAFAYSCVTVRPLCGILIWEIHLPLLYISSCTCSISNSFASPLKFVSFYYAISQIVHDNFMCRIKNKNIFHFLLVH